MTDLKDYKIRIYHPTTALMYREIVPETFISDGKPYGTSFDFTNARIGGCLDATITITARDPDLIGQGGGTWDNVLMPGAIVLIFIQAQSEATLKQRWIGVIEECGMGYGSNPHQRVLKCVGIWKYLRQYPVLTILEDKTIKESVLAILAKCTHSHLSTHTGYVTYDPDPTYDIAMMDCLDAWADQCFNELGTMAGPDAIWGLCPRNMDSPLADAFPALYFAQIGATAIDHGFEVGTNTVSDVVWTWDDRRLINGALIMGNAKLAGGDLILFVKPDGHANAIWRLARLDIPEAVDPIDMFRFGLKAVEARKDTDERVSLKALNFAEQPFANEIMNAPLSAIVKKGSVTPLEIYVDKYTFTMSGDGSVDTDFKLGKHPDLALWSAMPDVMRDVVTAKSNLFVSAADIAAGHRGILREWRRTAITDENMVNFWGVGMGDVASLQTADEWADICDDLGIVGFPLWSEVCWKKHADKEIVQGAQGDGSGVAVSVFIPTSDEDHDVTRVLGFVDSGDFEYWQGDAEWWEKEMWTTPNVTWGWDSTWYGRIPTLAGPATNSWKGRIYLNDKFQTACPESPMTVWIGRPNEHYTNTAVATYGNMKTQDAVSCTFIVFGANGTGTGLKGYCLAVYRAYGTNLAKFALGWYESGGFHSNYWLAGAAPDATAVGSVDLAAFGGAAPILSLDLKVDLPQATNGTFRVRVRKHDVGTDLWDSDDNHNPNTVNTTTAGLPDANYVQTTIWHKSARSQAADHQAFGVKKVTVTGASPLWYAVSKNGTAWSATSSGSPLNLTTGAAAWPDGKVGLRLMARFERPSDAMRAWAIAFRTTDEA